MYVRNKSSNFITQLTLLCLTGSLLTVSINNTMAVPPGPTLVTSTPIDNATGVSITTNFQLDFLRLLLLFLAT